MGVGARVRGGGGGATRGHGFGERGARACRSERAMTGAEHEARPVAVVTGASRGVGKGVALALGDAGYRVYLSGRTETGPLSIGATAEEVARRGGEGVPVRVDHAVDAEVEALFRRVEEESGRLDVLVNNVFAIPKERMWGVPFWEQPIHLWDQMHTVGLRSHYVASVHAAPLMVRAGRGLIANVSSFAGAGFQLNVAYGVGKAGVDRLAADMAHDLKPHGVTSLSLWPGIVRTEWVMAQEELPFSTEVSESPELTGRAVAALAADPELLARTGRVWIVAELAESYGFTDVDGTRPPSLRALAREARAKEKARQQSQQQQSQQQQSQQSQQQQSQRENGAEGER